jgi:LmbE family N-acetylglucosaminyl deacetylase
MAEGGGSLTFDIASLRTILGVWAHPDDETYLSAGIMAAAGRNGARVACVTATRGEEGSWDEERWPTATMGRVREAELLASLAILGVADHRWLDYYDGTCASQDHAQAEAKVETIMREVDPDTVLTFGPDGMTGHPDHKAVSAWTTRAFARAARPAARLYYATTTPEWAAEIAPRMEPFNVFMEPGTPPTTPRDRLAIAFDLPPDLLELKLRAIEAHGSQVEGMMSAFGRDYFREATHEETFRAAGSEAEGR